MSDWYGDAQKFAALCSRNYLVAALAAAFALGSLVLGAIKVFDEIGGRLRRWISPGTPGAKSRTVVAAAGAAVLLVVAAGLPYAAPGVLRFVDRARPHITEPHASRYLSAHPVVRWEYSDAGPETRYRLTVTDRVVGVHKHHCVAADSIAIEEQGRLSLKVGVYVEKAGAPPRDCKDVNILIESDEVPVELFANSVQRIRSLGTMYYAVHRDPSDGLFCYEDSNGDYHGFDRELIEAIAAELQRQYGLTKIQPIPIEFTWPEVKGAPHEGAVDLAIASISISPETAETYKAIFSEPYWQSDPGVVMHRPDRDARLVLNESLQDLKGKRIVYHANTTQVQLADQINQHFPGLIHFSAPAKDNNELLAMLDDNEVDGILYDLERSWSIGPPSSKRIPARLDIRPIDRPPERYGILFAALNDEFKADVDRALAAIGKVRIAQMIDVRKAALAGAAAEAKLSPDPSAGPPGAGH